MVPSTPPSRVYPVLVTTAAYAVAMLATGNVMLAFAAVLLGALVGLERRATGGIQAPVITHVLWSVAMLYRAPRDLRLRDRPENQREPSVSSRARRTASAYGTGSTGDDLPDRVSR